MSALVTTFIFPVSLRLPAPEAAPVSPEYEPIYLNDTCEYNSAVSHSTQLLKSSR